MIPRVSAIAASLPEQRLALAPALRAPLAEAAAAAAMPASNPPARMRVVAAIDRAQGASPSSRGQDPGAGPRADILA